MKRKISLGKISEEDSENIEKSDYDPKNKEVLNCNDITNSTSDASQNDNNNKSEIQERKKKENVDQNLFSAQQIVSRFVPDKLGGNKITIV